MVSNFCEGWIFERVKPEVVVQWLFPTIPPRPKGRLPWEGVMTAGGQAFDKGDYAGAIRIKDESGRPGNG